MAQVNEINLDLVPAGDALNEVIRSNNAMDLIVVDSKSASTEAVKTAKEAKTIAADIERRADEGEFGGGTYNHAELNNLDFEHSGHTGFASEEFVIERINEIEITVGII